MKNLLNVFDTPILGIPVGAIIIIGIIAGFSYRAWKNRRK